jgi:two-component system OmpR family response regulator
MRVLVVEDEPDLLFAVAQAIREEGYAVDTAEDGDEGLFKALGGTYDVIVLDLMLPKKDGWSVLRDLRRSHATPVLVLTARDAVPDRIKGLDSGADDYLTKPFELGELLARIRALIRRAAGKPSAMIAVGEIVVDTSAKAVTRRGHAVPLTAREYVLVEFLAMHRGELVTRSMIYDHLYDEDDDSLSNLIDVHVSNVRKKLGKSFITTRRGQGYVLGDTGGGGGADAVGATGSDAGGGGNDDEEEAGDA